MSDKKIIIRNCPATYLNFESKYVCTTQIKQKGFPFYCQDCTDCVMKQIVELCEQYKRDYNTTNGVWLLTNNITNLLDIQEVE